MGINWCPYFCMKRPPWQEKPTLWKKPFCRLVAACGGMRIFQPDTIRHTDSFSRIWLWPPFGPLYENHGFWVIMSSFYSYRYTRTDWNRLDQSLSRSDQINDHHYEHRPPVSARIRPYLPVSDQTRSASRETSETRSAYGVSASKRKFATPQRAQGRPRGHFNKGLFLDPGSILAPRWGLLGPKGPQWAHWRPIFDMFESLLTPFRAGPRTGEVEHWPLGPWN